MGRNSNDSQRCLSWGLPQTLSLGEASKRSCISRNNPGRDPEALPDPRWTPYSVAVL